MSLKSKLANDSEVIIRVALLEDSQRLAVLGQQLGYSTSVPEVLECLKELKLDSRRSCYVAQLQDGLVIGWIYVSVFDSLLTGRRTDIEGLIVDENYRGRGVGQMLMQQAEQWARQQGCRYIQVRSNVKRSEAHTFYEKVNYTAIKTQLVLRKVLNPLAGSSFLEEVGSTSRQPE